jgi:hypothetical protein
MHTPTPAIMPTRRPVFEGKLKQYPSREHSRVFQRLQVKLHSSFGQVQMLSSLIWYTHALVHVFIPNRQIRLTTNVCLYTIHNFR